MKKLQLAALLLLASNLVHAEANRAVLLDVSVQVAGAAKNFSYNTSPLLPIGEQTRLPIRSSLVNEGEFEIQIISSIPKNASGKNLLEVQIELFQNSRPTANKSLGRATIITRIHESAAVEQKFDNGAKVLFTVTPLEIQNP